MFDYIFISGTTFMQDSGLNSLSCKFVPLYIIVIVVPKLYQHMFPRGWYISWKNLSFLWCMVYTLENDNRGINHWKGVKLTGNKYRNRNKDISRRAPIGYFIWKIVNGLKN